MALLQIAEPGRAAAPHQHRLAVVPVGEGEPRLLTADLDRAQNKAVIGGAFTTVNGIVLRHVARLTPLGQVDPSFNPGAGAAAHFAGRTGQPGGAHILNAHNSAGLHHFQTSFQQQLFQERVSSLLKQRS